MGHRRGTGCGSRAALGSHELACGWFRAPLCVRFSALGGTRIPNLLIRSRIAVNGVPTCSFARKRGAKRAKLDAIEPVPRQPVAPLKDCRSRASRAGWQQTPEGPGHLSEPVKVRMPETPHHDDDLAHDVRRRQGAPHSAVGGVSTAVAHHEVVTRRNLRRRNVLGCLRAYPRQTR